MKYYPITGMAIDQIIDKAEETIMKFPNRKAERKVEREAEYEKEDSAKRAESRRKEALSMYLRIDEADASDDVKDILHRIVSHVGLE